MQVKDKGLQAAKAKISTLEKSLKNRDARVSEACATVDKSLQLVRKLAKDCTEFRYACTNLETITGHQSALIACSKTKILAQKKAIRLHCYLHVLSICAITSLIIGGFL